jgi:hypothetical protein
MDILAMIHGMDTLPMINHGLEARATFVFKDSGPGATCARPLSWRTKK